MEYLEPDPSEMQKTYGTAFHWTVQFLRDYDDKDLSMIYAFYSYAKKLPRLHNRELAQEKLNKLEEELTNPSSTFMVRFVNTLERLNIEKACASEVIAAASFDLNKKRALNHNQLMVYCYKNNAALSMMIAATLGAKGAKAISCAMDLGLGINLTTICANVLADAKRGRIYLPLTDLTRNHVNESDLKVGPTPEGLKTVIKKYLSLADTYYSSSLEGLGYLPFRARIGVLLSIRMYRELGLKLSRVDYEVLQGPVRLNAIEKVYVVGKTLLEALRFKFWAHRAKGVATE